MIRPVLITVLLINVGIHVEAQLIDWLYAYAARNNQNMNKKNDNNKSPADPNRQVGAVTVPMPENQGKGYP